MADPKKRSSKFLPATPRVSARPKRPSLRPPSDSLEAKLAKVEAELAEEKRERTADSDIIGQMLVRLAIAEELAKTTLAAGSRTVRPARPSSPPSATDIKALLERTIDVLEDADRRERASAEQRATALEDVRRMLAQLGGPPMPTFRAPAMAADERRSRPPRNNGG